MQGNKGLLESKTILGALIVLLAPLLDMLFGVKLDEATQLEISDKLEAILTAFGALLAIYGRVKATKKIGPDKIAPIASFLLCGLLLSGCAVSAVGDSLAHRYCAATTDIERSYIRARLDSNVQIVCDQPE